jgi:hypothetical protein
MENAQRSRAREAVPEALDHPERPAEQAERARPERRAVPEALASPHQ